MTRSGFKIPSSKFLALLCLPMIVALTISGYLTYASLTASEIAACGGGALFDCGHVLYSKWSKFAGFPVSGLALGTYVAMIGATIFTGWSGFSNSKRELAWTIVSGLAIAASLAAVYFICLQVFVLKHLCSYCLVAHGCGLLIATTILLTHRVGSFQLSSMSGLAAAGLAVLIAVQVNSVPPKTFKVETYEQVVVPTVNKDFEVYVGAPGEETMSSETSDDMFAPPTDDDLFMPPVEDDVFDPPVEPAEPSVIDTVDSELEENKAKEQIEDAVASAAKVSCLVFPRTTLLITSILQETTTPQSTQTEGKTETTKPERRVVSFAGGGTKLDVRQWPLAGSPDAKHIFVEMFDYTCPHCRSTYGAIRGAKETLGDDLSIVSLPVPLSNMCNPLITKVNPKHAESCQLSKLAICVWRADAEKFSEFHDWMFEGENCPQYNVALTKAIEIVGKESIEEQLNKPIADEYIKRHIQLYQRVGGGEVPKLLFPLNTYVGKYEDAAALTNIIKEQTGN